ncbi:MAG: uroporphyrinogen-III synthase [Nitrososphaerota archaeon]|nr:uroporphyrinogen-III synthase [Nitrososphaerota archaeon]
MTATTNHRLKVLLTRSAAGNKSISRMLYARGYLPVRFDTIEFREPQSWAEIDESLLSISKFDWIVLTSITGAKLFVQRMRFLGLPLPWKEGPSLAVVGNSTGSALKKAGLNVDFTPSEFLTEKLAEELPLERGRRVLLLRSDIVNGKMKEILKSRGFEIVEHAIYITKSVSNTRGSPAEDVDVITFASPSAVDSFCKSIPSSDLARFLGKKVVCIGPVTAEAAKRWGFVSVDYPRSHTFKDLIERIGASITVEN